MFSMTRATWSDGDHIFDYQRATKRLERALDLADVGETIGVEQPLDGVFGHLQLGREVCVGYALFTHGCVEGELRRNDERHSDKHLSVGERAGSR